MTASPRWTPDDGELDAVARTLDAPAPSHDRAEQMRTALLAAAATRAQLPRTRPWRAIAFAGTFAAAAAVIVWLVARPSAPQVAARETITPIGVAKLAPVHDWPDRVVALGDGTIAVEVAALGSGERFRITTKDAEVEVRGTRFEVSAAHDRIAMVAVSAGRVELRVKDQQVVVLGAGETWSATRTAQRDDLVRERGEPGAAGAPGATRDSAGHEPGAARDVAAREPGAATAHEPGAARGANEPAGATAHEPGAVRGTNEPAGATAHEPASVRGTNGLAGATAHEPAAVRGTNGLAGATAHEPASVRGTNEPAGATAHEPAGATAHEPAAVRGANEPASATAHEPGAVRGANAATTTHQRAPGHQSAPAHQPAPERVATHEPTTPSAQPQPAAQPPLVAPQTSAPKPGEGEFRAGWAALRANDASAAAKAFATACSEAQHDALGDDACFWAGAAAKRAGDDATARAALEKFVKAFPSSARVPEASALLGWLLYDAGDLDAAQARFERAKNDRVPKVRDSATRGLEAIRRKRESR